MTVKISTEARLILLYLQQHDGLYLEENRPCLDTDEDIFTFLQNEGMSWSEFEAAKNELIAAGLAGLVGCGAMLTLAEPEPPEAA